MRENSDTRSVRSELYKPNGANNMTGKDFWMSIYIGAIVSGQPPLVAKGYADDALGHLISKWAE